MKETIEKYLQVIYILSLASDGPVKSIDVGKKLGESRPDVFRALKTLKTIGYIDQKYYGGIELTEKGRVKAIQLIEVHGLIVQFLSERLGLSFDEAQANAVQIEHVLSDNAVNKIIEYFSKG